MKYQTYNPSFGSKSSYGYSGSKTMVSTTESSLRIITYPVDIQLIM